MSSDEPDAQLPANQTPKAAADNSQAVELIRAKIDLLYDTEPNAKQEADEAEAVHKRSKHQQFMHELTNSNKSLVEIQTAWHNYYIGLPDKEKHEVWQEFYANQKTLRRAQAIPKKHTAPEVTHTATQPATKTPAPASTTTAQNPAENVVSTAKDLKDQLLKTINARATSSHKRKHQLKSLGFGLSMGVLVTIIMLFGFFNERFIAPFITPSRTVSATPIISELNAPDEQIPPNSVIIIPKINIEIPVVYDEPSIDEAAVQRALEKGVLHYPTTPNPGENGNATFFGHSSSNILNNGKYKFAFVLLNRLNNGDTFMIQKDSKRYIYRVFEKKVVPPTEVSVLNNREKPTATLITCDPPGTATNRLIVVGEQISPDPVNNIASSVPEGPVATPQTLPSESPTLWSRLWGWLTG